MKEKIKSIKIGIVSYLIKVLYKWDAALKGEAFNPNPKHFDDLTPTRSPEMAAPYIERLLWALRNRDVKNIALTGSYGSGKSSIIRMFIAAHPEFSYLTISLASFTKNDVDEEPEKVEFSILQQIFYHVKGKDLPDSRFNRIKKLSRFERCAFPAAILFVLWAFVQLLFPDFFNKFDLWKTYYATNEEILGRIALLVIAAGIYFAVLFTLRIFKRSKFNKLNLSSGEFELIPKESDSSILNKYMDELIYFFQVTSYDVLIIEDLDRFKDTGIFTKLREINTLINNSTQINRRVTFVYAVKDDLFPKTGSRTKFFDYIIPIIPVINTSNSGDKLAEKLNKFGLKQGISDDFIYDITLYIDDMRVLKNIVNEYGLYKEVIGSWLNKENLFGFIVYKNLYPDDAALLNANKGTVYTVFNKKDEIIRFCSEALRGELNKINTDITNIEKENLKDVHELQVVYLSQLFESLPIGSTINQQDMFYDVGHYSRSGDFDSLIKQKEVLTYSREGTRNIRIDFQEIQKQVDPSHTYEERLANITNRSSEHLNLLKIKAEEIRTQIVDIEHSSISEILQQYESDIIKTTIGGNKLITYLLRYGYIDEMYHSYISYFYPGSLSFEDMQFVQSIKNRSALQHLHPLSNVKKILERLRPSEFAYKEVLNLQLIDWLCTHHNDSSVILRALFTQLSNESSTSIDFIEQYIKNGKSILVFIRQLCNSWPGYWAFVSRSNYSNETISEHLLLILQYGKLNDILVQDKGSILSTYIENKEDFLVLVDNIQDLPKVENLIAELKIRFEILDIQDSENRLWKFIYRNNWYQLNPKMISVIMKLGGTTNLSYALETSNYTTILQSDCHFLKEYIEQRISRYVRQVLLVLPENKFESEGTILKLLNNEYLSQEEKITIIAKQNNKLSVITDVGTEIWPMLMEENKLAPTWENILNYHNSGNTLDEHLISFLNNNSNVALLTSGKNDIESTFPRDKYKILFFDIVFCNQIGDSNYESLIEFEPFSFDYPPDKGLSISKIRILIKYGVFPLSMENLTALKQLQPDLHLSLIEKHISGFIKNIDNYQLETTEWKHLINSPAISRDQKYSILEKFKPGTFDTDSSLSEDITKFILGDSRKINYGVFTELLHSKISQIILLKLFITQIPFMVHNQITESLTLLGAPYIQLTESQKRPSFEPSSDNQLLAEKLLTARYIANFKMEGDKLRINTRKIKIAQ
ncbi:YobI family P-loop NTPase [Chitinophaga sp. RAB17]|uniref:YobI family P-loop NTPase n=1 Tax=Chitinophaga sp. RAB17 TaxID=3233049 RepID=UPI003F8DE5A8